MASQIKVGAAWKDFTPSVRVGGVWKTCDKIHIRTGGVWKEAWAASAANTITLHGTSGSPVVITDTDGTAAVTVMTFYGDNAAQSGFAFEGRLYVKGDTPPIGNYDVGNAWTSEQDAVSNAYWIRYTAVSGNTANIVHSGQSGFGVWHPLTNGSDTGITSSISLSAAGKGAFTYDAVVKVEISDDSGGSNILATGYYNLVSILT